MRWLMRVISWQSTQPAAIRWLEVLGLFCIALSARFALGVLYGATPSLTFYPAILIAVVILGWKEALVLLVLSATAGLYLFLPPNLYLQPVGWLLVGGLTIAIIEGLKESARHLAAANERQRLLFRELQHRVANTLQAVVGTLEKAQWKIDPAPSEAKAILADAAQRISRSADMHRRLHDPKLFEHGLTAILHDAVATVIDGPATTVELDVAPLQLSFDQMSVITMLVIEVANNAQKHVFRHDRGRSFLVSLQALPKGLAILLVKDDGPGWAPSESGDYDRTLGLTIIQGLTEQLGGTLDVRWENGTEVSIIFPLLPRS